MQNLKEYYLENYTNYGLVKKIDRFYYIKKRIRYIILVVISISFNCMFWLRSSFLFSTTTVQLLIIASMWVALIRYTSNEVKTSHFVRKVISEKLGFRFGIANERIDSERFIRYKREHFMRFLKNSNCLCSQIISNEILASKMDRIDRRNSKSKVGIMSFIIVALSTLYVQSTYYPGVIYYLEKAVNTDNNNIELSGLLVKMSLILLSILLLTCFLEAIVSHLINFTKKRIIFPITLAEKEYEDALSYILLNMSNISVDMKETEGLNIGNHQCPWYLEI